MYWTCILFSWQAKDMERQIWITTGPSTALRKICGNVLSCANCKIKDDAPSAAGFFSHPTSADVQLITSFDIFCLLETHLEKQITLLSSTAVSKANNVLAALQHDTTLMNT